jgi:gluconolactonase
MSRTARTVASGLRFPEGPTALDDGAIAVAEMQGEGVARVAPDGAVTQLADLGGGPNGTTLGSDGALYVANNGGLSAARDGFWHAPRELDGCVQRVAGDGPEGATVVGGTLPGAAPHRPNDLCFAPDGTLLVTDSADWEHLPKVGPGRVVAIGEDGSARQLVELAGMPNGIAFAPGGDQLYIVQTLTRQILAYDWRDGALANERVACTLPNGMPDGICFDADGTLWACASTGDAVYAFDADGTVRETIETGRRTQPTNCCLSDGELFVTLSFRGELVAYDVAVSELPLHRGALPAGQPMGAR